MAYDYLSRYNRSLSINTPPRLRERFQKMIANRTRKIEELNQEIRLFEAQLKNLDEEMKEREST
jgi:hypothetical protein